MSVIVPEHADYPGALWMPAHATNYRKGRRGRAWSQIVVHCTDGKGDARAVADMWRKPRHGTSAHFVVGQDGSVIQCVRLTDTAWHAHTANSDSVGIEHCCRTRGEWSRDDPGMPPSEALLLSAAQLTAWLCLQIKRSPSRTFIRGHAEADPSTTHTGCPTSAGIDLDAYVARVVACGDWGV